MPAKLPYLSQVPSATQKYVVAFRGLNLGEGYQDGDLLDCQNISTEKFPCVTQRAERTLEAEYTGKMNGMQAKDGLMIMDDNIVRYPGLGGGLRTVPTNSRKQTAVIGKYIVIFPDKYYIDTEAGQLLPMEAEYTAAGLVFTDSSITTTGDDWPFRKGDAVEITGCTTTENNKTPVVRAVDGKTLTFYSNTFAEATEEGEVTVARRVPDLDFICESNYRLWGTKGNTIYASKYGDPLNFFCYDGLTSDSYYIDVASDGEFTGCIPYSSHICFFKEHTLHKLYGSKPSNYQLVNSQVYGVQAGSERSLCIVNEQLFYKGVNGVYVYTGGVPELVSEAFGTKRFTDACAASDGERYYIGMKSGNEWGLYVYDVLRGIWVKEDDLRAVDMAFSDGYLYILDSSGGLYKVDRTLDRSKIEWSVTFCPFNETMKERKGFSKFHLRVELSAGAWIGVDMKTDQDQMWRRIHTSHSDRAKIISIPIIPTRCDSVTVRVYGKGNCLFKTFVREFTTGSDV